MADQVFLLVDPVTGAQYPYQLTDIGGGIYAALAVPHTGSGIESGDIIVGASSPAPLRPATTKVASLLLSASSGNRAPIYLGGATVSGPADGFVLDPGGQVTLAGVDLHLLSAIAKLAQDTPYAGVINDGSAFAYYRLNEAAGATAFDVAGSHLDGVISGTVAYSQVGALIGDPDTAMGFDGAAGATAGTAGIALTLTGIDTTAGHRVGVEAWVRWNNSHQNGAIIFGFPQYALIVDSLGLGFTTLTAITDLWGAANTVLPAASWHHLYAEFVNGGPVGNALWVDGVKQTLTQRGVAATARSVTTAGRISGWSTNANYKWDGLLDEVALYQDPHLLTDEQVQRHYLAGEARQRLGLLAVRL